MKVVINACFGGFSLSPEAELKLYERGVTDIATHVDEYWPPEKRAEEEGEYKTMGYTHTLKEWRKYRDFPKQREGRHMFLTTFSPDEQYVIYGRNVRRDNPELIKIVEEMGEAADGPCARLKIVEIPDGIDYEISEYDGSEHIAEKHRTWG